MLMAAFVFVSCGQGGDAANNATAEETAAIEQEVVELDSTTAAIEEVKQEIEASAEVLDVLLKDLN